MSTTIDYTTLPFTGHTGVLVNDHLRGIFGQTPQIPAIRQRQEVHRLQTQQFEQKRQQDQKDLESARAQIAAIAAAQTPTPAATAKDVPAATHQSFTQGWRHILSR